MLVHTHVFLKERERERERERENERETPAGLHIGDMIVFSISHL
jgi:hypothetical protein